jgi:hypothetical protein
MDHQSTINNRKAITKSPITLSSKTRSVTFIISMKVIKTVALACLALPSKLVVVSASSARGDPAKDYDPSQNILNVHIVPHTHDDVGWLKTGEPIMHSLHIHKFLTCTCTLFALTLLYVCMYSHLTQLQQWNNTTTDKTTPSATHA